MCIYTFVHIYIYIYTYILLYMHVFVTLRDLYCVCARRYVSFSMRATFQKIERRRPKNSVHWLEDD